MCLLAAEPHSTTGLLFPSVPLWNNLVDPIFDGVVLVDFKSRANAFWLLLTPFLSPAVFPFSSFITWVGIVGLGSLD